MASDPKRPLVQEKPSYAENLRLATSRIRGWQAEQAQERETEPIARPVAPDRVTTSSGEVHERKGVHDRHPLDANYADSTYEALGRDRSVQVRPGGTRADSIVAFQNKYRATPEVTEELYDAARDEGLRPEMLFGVAHEETQFRPSLVSSVGAVGAIQVVPERAGAELGYSPEELKSDFRKPIRAGAEYLADQLEVTGDEMEALGRYRHGPTGYYGRNPATRDNYGKKVLGRARKQPK